MPDLKNYFRPSIAVCIFATLFFFIAAIILIYNYISVTIVTKEHFTNSYSDCIASNGLQCRYSLNQCYCYLKFNIDEPIHGYVGLYYEWEPSDYQAQDDYNTSRDDKQLAGILDTNVTGCGDFSYDDHGKPIAPCGAIADSMFLDKFTLIDDDSTIYSTIQLIDTGLDGITEEDRKRFHNPPGDLQEAFQKFSKPKSWDKNIWQLDDQNATNNGFQNERFIAWMNTDLKRKPYSRLNPGIYENGLPAGNYTLRVNYQRKSDEGSRKVILASKNPVTLYNYVNYVIGILCAIAAFLLPMSAICYFYAKERFSMF